MCDSDRCSSPAGFSFLPVAPLRVLRHFASVFLFDKKLQLASVSSDSFTNAHVTWRRADSFLTTAFFPLFPTSLLPKWLQSAIYLGVRPLPCPIESLDKKGTPGYCLLRRLPSLPLSMLRHPLLHGFCDHSCPRLSIWLRALSPLSFTSTFTVCFVCFRFSAVSPSHTQKWDCQTFSPRLSVFHLISLPGFVPTPNVVGGSDPFPCLLSPSLS